MSLKTYDVRYLSNAAIKIDGVLDEPAWRRADVLHDFSFPWIEAAAPRTEFRALCDDESLYFSFSVRDDDIVVVDDFKDKWDVTKEDRVELFLSNDPEMKQYWCLEIDPLGRTLDYAAKFYRQHDISWNCPGLRTGASRHENGYIVEAAIPLATLRSLGLPPLDCQDGIHAGIYRGEFSRDENNQTIENWMSWVDPKVPSPDFHIPATLGRLRMRK